MKVKIIKSVLFLVSLLMLQQGIAYSNRFDTLSQHSAVIKENDIDPAALFYMESKMALDAEKRVRSKLE
jgi:hypothetical protein